MYSDLAYAPFGETYSETGTPDRSFTGQNQDTAPGSTAGLYDFTSREFAQYGRWISPDPAGNAAADPASPQTWNRYGYVINAPLNTTDPSGMRPPSYHPILYPFLWFEPYIDASGWSFAPPCFMCGGGTGGPPTGNNDNSDNNSGSNNSDVGNPPSAYNGGPPASFYGGGIWGSNYYAALDTYLNSIPYYQVTDSGMLQVVVGWDRIYVPGQPIIEVPIWGNVAPIGNNASSNVNQFTLQTGFCALYWPPAILSFPATSPSTTKPSKPKAVSSPSGCTP